MRVYGEGRTLDLAQRLAEAEATIEALLSGQIDAVVDSGSTTPVMLAKAHANTSRGNHRNGGRSARGVCTL
jgi:hypothetical protein